MLQNICKNRPVAIEHGGFEEKKRVVIMRNAFIQQFPNDPVKQSLNQDFYKVEQEPFDPLGYRYQ